jgi:hypothetical protein
VRYSQWLDENRIVASVGSKGDRFDNASNSNVWAVPNVPVDGVAGEPLLRPDDDPA